MPYLVVRVGQLVEHSYQSAHNEAKRLAMQTGGSFYVANCIAVTEITKKVTECVEFTRNFANPVPVKTEENPPNAGARWSREDDVKMMELWMKGWHVDKIAAKLGRSRVSIQCRLSKYGFDAYDILVYKG